MTRFQEPLEKGWLRTVLRDVREEADRWTVSQESSSARTHAAPAVTVSENEQVDQPH